MMMIIQGISNREVLTGQNMCHCTHTHTHTHTQTSQKPFAYLQMAGTIFVLTQTAVGTSSGPVRSGPKAATWTKSLHWNEQLPSRNRWWRIKSINNQLYQHSNCKTNKFLRAFMYICMYICMCVYVCMYACMYVCMYVCMHACMYVCMHVCMYCMYVCMYCMYVWMYVWMCVCM